MTATAVVIGTAIILAAALLSARALIAFTSAHFARSEQTDLTVIDAYGNGHVSIVHPDPKDRP